MRIVEVGGEYQGRIERIFPQPGEDPNPRCDECAGARHGQPLAGLVILEHLRREGDDYVGGQILDPETGGVYRARARLAKDGAELGLRGYIGLSLFGRTQTWLRAAP